MHVDPSLNPLTKGKNNYKLDKDCVKIKLHRDPTSQKSDVYELKMTLFGKDEVEEFLIFIRNLNMTLEESIILVASARIQNLPMLVCG